MNWKIRVVLILLVTFCFILYHLLLSNYLTAGVQNSSNPDKDAKLRIVAEIGQSLPALFPSVLLMITSFQGSTGEFISTVLKEFAFLCEIGFDLNVLVIFDENFPLESGASHTKAANCIRKEMAITYQTFRSFSENLATAHRIVAQQSLQNYNLFIHIQEGSFLTSHHVLLYLSELQRLRLAESNPSNQRTFKSHGLVFPGFLKSFKSGSPENTFLWGLSMADTLVLRLAGTQYLSINKTLNSGVWIADSKQLEIFDKLCNFLHPVALDITASDNGGFILGGLDIYDSTHCNFTQIVPAENFDKWLVLDLNKSSDVDADNNLLVDDIVTNIVLKLHARSFPPKKEASASKFSPPTYGRSDWPEKLANPFICSWERCQSLLVQKSQYPEDDECTWVPEAQKPPGKQRCREIMAPIKNVEPVTEKPSVDSDTINSIEKYLQETWVHAYIPDIAPELFKSLEERTLEVAPKVLFVFSSTDRGQRASAFKGDKLIFMLMVTQELAKMCEAGFEIHMHFITNYLFFDTAYLFQYYSFCSRLGSSFHLSFEEYEVPVEGDLSHKHRRVYTERLKDFDLFIHSEDDMLVTRGFIYTSVKLSLYLSQIRAQKKNADSQRFFPGAFRVESGHGGIDGLGQNAFEWEKEGEFYTWENPLKKFNLLIENMSSVKLARLNGNSNQAVTVLTRIDLIHLNETMQYLWPLPKAGSWVEWWSGGLQLWSKYDKILFADELFWACAIHHLANNKHGQRGEIPPPSLSDIAKKLKVPQSAPKL